ncbi:MAG: hypothetical protein AAB074_05170 [Planctomycetota bacterium]
MTAFDAPSVVLPGRLVLTTRADGTIAILNTVPGEEAMALYEVDPVEGIRFVAGRRVTWDLHAYDFSANGKGISVADVQRAVEMAERRRQNKPFQDELRAAEARRRAEAERLQKLNEEEAARLREREGK